MIKITNTLKTRIAVWLLLIQFILAACAPAGQTPRTDATPTPSSVPTTRVPDSPVPSISTPGDRPQPAPTNVRIQDDNEYYVPSLLPYDAILPVYQPRFSTPDGIPLQDDELVMGVVIDNEAKAYPVSVLRFREMVIDELAGWPILVSW